MSTSLSDVFRVLNQLLEDEIVRGYAIGGATAALFYAEPTRTYDLDVFITSSTATSETLAPLQDIYRWAEANNFVADAEHILVHGVPVQFIPAYNQLAASAVAHAREHDYDGVAVRVVDPEHLVALALQAGGGRRRERAWQLLQAGTVDRRKLAALLDSHHIEVSIPDDV